jgi:hypothetical protein
MTLKTGVVNFELDLQSHGYLSLLNNNQWRRVFGRREKPCEHIFQFSRWRIPFCDSLLSLGRLVEHSICLISATVKRKS